MRYRVLEGGAIACSTVFIWGWASPPGLDSGSEICESPSATTPTKTPSLRQNCLQKSGLFSGGIVPESIFNLRWGGDQTNRPIKELENVYETVLTQAQETAKRDRLPEAIISLGGIPKNSRHYPLAKQLQDDWSRELLQRATQQHQQANLSVALKLLNTIPSVSQHYSHAMELSKQWRWEATLMNRINQAKAAGNWNAVANVLKQLEGTSLYQSTLIQKIVQDAMSQQWQPDSHLMQIASDTATIAPASSIRRSGSMPQLPEVPVETTPQNSQLDIATEQALTWAQPPRPKAIAKTPPQKTTTTQPNNGDTSTPTPMFPYQRPNPTATRRSIPTIPLPKAADLSPKSELDLPDDILPIH
ncbi:MAG: hypothetical protein NW224_00145 [Leptolyngbyaceae cyanobacterium bins.302]|nr:hypothetical protein [Leptolyngbyaceae cyanobacterium bins.302]